MYKIVFVSYCNYLSYLFLFLFMHYTYIVAVGIADSIWIYSVYIFCSLYIGLEENKLPRQLFERDWGENVIHTVRSRWRSLRRSKYLLIWSWALSVPTLCECFGRNALLLISYYLPFLWPSFLNVDSEIER